MNKINEVILNENEITQVKNALEIMMENKDEEYFGQLLADREYEMLSCELTEFTLIENALAMIVRKQDLLIKEKVDVQTKIEMVQQSKRFS